MKTILAFWLSTFATFIVCGTAHAAEEGGALKGIAKYDGDPPAQKIIDVSDSAGRRNSDVKSVPDDSLVVDPKTKGIQWVIVRIMNATPKDAPPKPAHAPTINQKDYKYTPHVLIVPPNTDIEILNPDKSFNNFHSLPFYSDNPQNNFGMQPHQEKVTYKAEWLKDPDIIQFRSDM